MHSMITLFNGADIKIEVANFCAAMDTLIDQDEFGNAMARISTLMFGFNIFYWSIQKD